MATPDPAATETIDLGPVVVTVARGAGPRVLDYRRHDGPSLFAAVPDAAIDHPGGGMLRLLGGHRLWQAPEIPESTYLPDDGIEIEMERSAAGIGLTAPAGPGGIAKTIRLEQRGALTVVEHTLHNHGSGPVRVAAWAITQFAPGGAALLPLLRDPVDPGGLRANRHLVLWPYTDLSAPELELRRDAIVVHGSGQRTMLKVGQPNQRGWMAYQRDTEIFVKWSPLHRAGAEYADRGASTQCYRDERFVELETLGPLVDLGPGDRVIHREGWMLLDTSERDTAAVLEALPAIPAGFED